MQPVDGLRHRLLSIPVEFVQVTAADAEPFGEFGRKGFAAEFDDQCVVSALEAPIRTIRS
jgi:hypothetical protein